MRTRNPDLAVRILVGVIALPVLTVVAYSIWNHWGGVAARTAVAAAPEGEVRDGPPRAVRFDLPAFIEGTPLRISIVRNGAGNEWQRDYRQHASSAMQRTASSESDPDGPIVNVAILSAPGVPARLIFDRPVYIREVIYPGARFVYRNLDSLMTWISYELADKDTDDNGVLDVRDHRTLYVSDLDGDNLRRVIPDGWVLRHFEPQRDRRSMVVTAIRGPAPEEDDWTPERSREHSFIYDVPGAELRSFTELDSLAARAGVILSAPRREQ
jgi:hypothetical protein